MDGVLADGLLEPTPSTSNILREIHRILGTASYSTVRTCNRTRVIVNDDGIVRQVVLYNNLEACDRGQWEPMTVLFFKLGPISHYHFPRP